MHGAVPLQIEQRRYEWRRPRNPTGSPALPRMRRQYADSEEHHMKNTALVVIDLQSDITKNYRDIIEAVNAAIGWPV